MKVESLPTGQWLITFDAKEKEFIKSEAAENSLSVKGMFLMIFGMLFIGGYSNIIGKDKANELER